jgi:O-antigen/teichoic acid export membrane protein
MSATVADECNLEEPPRSGSHERHLAAGSVAQQVTLVVGTLTMFAVITVIGRTFSLSEFGAYGLLISIPTYLLFAQASVETVAIRAIAQAREQLDRDRAFTTALSLYALFGVLAALLIVFGGTMLLGVFHIAPGLHNQARLGLVALGLVNLVGWPVKSALDALRGSGCFVLSASVEALGYTTCGALVVAAVLLSAPLWLIVGLGGAISLSVGLWAGLALFLTRLPIRPRLSTLSLPYTRSFLSLSLLLLVGGVTDLLIYSIDRTILGIYRPVSTVGLYEGPIRAHNLLRQLQGALALTVMPAAAVYVATDDRPRLRELLLRGTRYVAITMMPFTIVLMTLAGPILEVWLGRHFLAAARAMTILVSYWLLLGGSSVGLSMMIAAGRVKTVVVYSSSVAVLNLALSLALAPSLGLDGVVIGTSLPYALVMPVFVYLVCRTFAVSIVEYLREGFTTAVSVGGLLAAGELLARALLPIERPAVLLGCIGLGLTSYAALVYRFGLRPRERLLVHTTLAGAQGRLASLRRQIALAWLARSA